LFTESKKKLFTKMTENNSSGDEEELLHEEITSIKIYKDALIQIKNLGTSVNYNFACKINIFIK